MRSTRNFRTGSGYPYGGLYALGAALEDAWELAEDSGARLRAEELMRRAAREHQEAERGRALEEYLDRWLYDEMGYGRGESS